MVAIVVPISNRPQLTADEEISLRHLRHFLGSYDKFVIAPKGLKFQLPGFKTLRFSQKYFGSARAHGRLLFQADFYKTFDDYKYILIYHLDALVFSDELMKWCETDVDYIGAPWFSRSDPWNTEPIVGNGGLALMKIETVLNVLCERYRDAPVKYWEDRFERFLRVLPKILSYPKRLTPAWLRGSRSERLSKRLQTCEIHLRGNDSFWSYDAVKYVPGFKIPGWRTALRFSFECHPRKCFELNGLKLPFGCHAWPRSDNWPRYEREFWEPYLLK